jgi:hypothetical protein
MPPQSHDPRHPSLLGLLRGVRELLGGDVRRVVLGGIAHGDDAMTFEEWLRSPEGKKCQSWPVTDVTFLRNRLWWAYQAGLEEGSYPRPVDTADG